MKFNQGMWLNGKASNNPEGTTRKNQNIVVSKNTGSATNEEGFNFFSVQYNARNITPIGTVGLNNDRILVFSLAGQISEVGVIEADNSYVVLSIDPVWNFGPEAPIHGEYQMNSKGEIIVAFTDRIRNPPRVININSIPNPLTADSILMFPNFVEPTMSMSEIEVGGTLKSGAIYVTARYIDGDRNKTRWFRLTKPFFVTEDTKSEGFDNYDGCIANTTTTKALRVTFTGVDLRYISLEVAVAHKIDGVIIGKVLSEFTLKEGLQAVITGNEQFTTASFQDLVEENASYDRIYAITQLDNTLYGGNVTENTIDTYQKYANNIRLNVVSKKVKKSDFTGSDKTEAGFLVRGHKHGETYAKYFHFLMNDGSSSRGFLISGRRATSIGVPIDGSSSVAVLPETMTCQNVYNTGVAFSVNLNYIREDVAINPAVKYFQTRDTSFNPNATTNFGLWENDTETYPDTTDFDVWDANGFVDTFRNERVRHHRYPTIEKCKKQFYNSDPLYAVEYLDVLGFEIDPTSLYIPPEILSQIKGYYITYAERTVENSSVIGQDLLMFGANHGVGTPIRSTGGNWDTLNLSNGQVQSIERREARFHCFDIIRNKPSIIPSFIRNNLRMKKQSELYDINGTYNSNAYVAVHVSDFGKGSHFIQSSGDNRIEYPALSDAVRQITDYKYVPNNVIDGSLDNRFLEEFIYAKITNAQGIDINVPAHGNYFAGSNINSNSRAFIQIDNTNILFGAIEETYLTDICTLYNDMYISFYNQRVVSTGFTFLKGQSVTGVQVFGGDVFTCYHSFVEFGIRDQFDYNPLDSQKGLKCFKRFVHETVSNTEMRWYNEADDKGSYYYPFGGTPTPIFTGKGFGYFRDLEPNNFLYNKDYSSIQNLNGFVPYNPTEVFVTKHPNRIVRSLKSNPEEATSSWRTFKANDYYETKKNLGEIIRLQGYDDKLIINQRYSTSVTVGNETLPTSTGEVSLGKGDIFRMTPEELVVDKDGYVGVQHRYGCLLTKYGDVTIDAEHGKIFIYDGKIRELTRENKFAMFSFFRDSCAGMEDNPFAGIGFSLAFDRRYERLIITKKKYTLNVEGQSLFNGSQRPTRYIERLNGRWVFVDTGIGLYQTIFIGDERFWTSDSWTISYSFDEKAWTCFHTYFPDYIFNTRNKLLSFKNNKSFLHNIEGKKAIYYDQQGNPHESYITPVFVSPYLTRDRARVSSEFLSLSILTEIYDSNQVLIKDKSISLILAYNSYQSTGNITIIPYNKSLTLEQNFDVTNINNAKNTFTYNSLRDVIIDRKLPFIDDYESIEANIDHNKPFHLKRRMIDKFLVVKLLYNNEKIANLQYDIHFGDISIYTKPSTR